MACASSKSEENSAGVIFLSLLTPDLFYKRRSQEKTPLRWLKRFLLLSPRDGAGSVLTVRTRRSVAGHIGPAI
jgi:hypothetical protein